MYDDRGSAIAEKRMTVAAKIHILTKQFHRRLALRINREVVHVAGVMPIRILQPVLLAIRIKVRPCRFEVRSLALGHRMKMDCVLPRSHVVKRELHVYTLRS